jgi:hypothetical protein
MEHKTYEGKRIQEITAEGLVYLNDSGGEEFIDFSACFAKHYKYVTSPEYIAGMKELNPQFRWDEEGVKEYIQECTEWREVGQRNIDGLYVVFYTDPPIQFDLETKDEFYQVTGTLRRLGWKTFDQT